MHGITAKLGGVIMAGGAVLMLGAGGTALAATAGHSSVTGPETIEGTVYGKAATANTPRIPLRLKGVVETVDPTFVLGNGHSNTHTLRTPAGRLTVRGVGKQHTTTQLNTRVCHATYTVRQQVNFVPSLSTGKFYRASGPAAYQVRFAAYFPRYRHGKNKGKCDFNARPFNRGAVTSFLAAGVLTVK